MGDFNGIAMLITSNGRNVNVDWALSLVTFQYPMGMSTAWFLAKGLERGLQRDALAERAVQIGAEYMMFIDDDTIIPNYTIQQLHYQMNQHPDAAIVGGIYCTKAVNPEPLVFQKLGGGPFWNWKLGDVFECAGLGTGCMMIRTECLKNIPKPWFVDQQLAPVGTTINCNGIEMPLSKQDGTDDLYFCKKVTEAGYKIYAHGGVLPVHVGQDGTMYSLPLDSFPCKAFDAEIKAAQEKNKSEFVFSAKSEGESV